MLKGIKMTKTITQASDLEGIQPLEEVELKYKYRNPLLLPQNAKGIYAGSFQLMDDQYIVLSTLKNSVMNQDIQHVLSEVYDISKYFITKNKEVALGSIKKSESNQELEARLKIHVNEIMNKIASQPKYRLKK